jgi:hypothetical protein
MTQKPHKFCGKLKPAAAGKLPQSSLARRTSKTPPQAVGNTVDWSEVCQLTLNLTLVCTHPFLLLASRFQPNCRRAGFQLSIFSTFGNKVLLLGLLKVLCEALDEQNNKLGTVAF